MAAMVDDAREEGRCGGRRLDQLSRGQASPTGRWRMSHVASVCGRDAVRGGRVCGGMRDLDEGGGTNVYGTRNDLSGAHQRSRSRRGGHRWAGTLADGEKKINRKTSAREKHA